MWCCRQQGLWHGITAAIDAHSTSAGHKLTGSSKQNDTLIEILTLCRYAVKEVSSDRLVHKHDKSASCSHRQVRWSNLWLHRSHVEWHKGKPCTFLVSSARNLLAVAVCRLTGVCNLSSVVWCADFSAAAQNGNRTQKAFTSCKIPGQQSTIIALNSYWVYALLTHSEHSMQ